ncbi:MAG: class I fructose-bisphosphate aldolase family protein [Nitrososphaerota archaeon]|nr:class I fructose-bisphosphate aldolase family protein [Nitrososphaerota archaeon]MDG6938820.1 class I fructose-bisphosphate aldolase family protein [Nitrososphaerota archaeon]
MVFGKQVRISRITRDGRMLCVPMDHGITNGPMPGLVDPAEAIRRVSEGGATSVLAHKGIVKALPTPPPTGIIIHLSANTSLGPSSTRKVLVGSVEEAMRLGADAVSVHINIGSKEEPEMLEQLGAVSDSCDELQMPLIAMMYPRGENVKDPSSPEVVAHVARVGAEAGADIVKTVYTGDRESFRSVVRGCPCPVVLAGGPRLDDDTALLRTAFDAVQAGAMGVTFGRNVFQHSDPTLVVRALHRVVIEGRDVREGLEVLRRGKK